MRPAAALARRLLHGGPALRSPFAAEASQPPSSSSLVFHEYGAPESVIRLQHDPAPSAGALKDNEVLINILAAPINPSDVNTIEGTYPLKPQLPGIPGHEGVGVVAAVGPKVTRMRPGDRVVPIEHSQGTWRTHGIFQQQYWYRIPHDLPLATAATMVINPPSALRMLEEFVTLKPGDTIVQTAATSSAGKYVVQLARSKGLNTICVIRDRPNRHEAEQELKDLGASLVVTREELRKAMADWAGPAPALALDCVGGDATRDVARVMAPGATLVVYGAMSQQPITIPASSLIFQDLRVRGFWLTGGYAKMKDGWKAKEQLVDRVVALFRQRVIRPVTVDCVPLHRWQEALERHRQGHTDAKVLLTNYEDDVEACMR